jgi:hypothetical protein
VVIVQQLETQPNSDQARTRKGVFDDDRVWQTAPIVGANVEERGVKQRQQARNESVNHEVSTASGEIYYRRMSRQATKLPNPASNNTQEICVVINHSRRFPREATGRRIDQLGTPPLRHNNKITARQISIATSATTSVRPSGRRCDSGSLETRVSLRASHAGPISFG